MNTIYAIASAIAALAGIVLWLLKNYYSLAANIAKLEKERDTIDKKLEQAIYAGNGNLIGKLHAERMRVSKELRILYARRSKSYFYRA